MLRQTYIYAYMVFITGQYIAIFKYIVINSHVGLLIVGTILLKKISTIVTPYL